MASAFCNSLKEELLMGGHCFNATATGITTTNTSGTNTLTVSSTSGYAVGMAVTGTGIPGSSFIVSMTATVITINNNTTQSNPTITITGDVFKMLLIGATTTYSWLSNGASVTNVGTPGTGTPSASNIGTDETSGTGYTAGGVALTNVQPSIPATPGTVGTTSFSPNPSWTSATFSALGAVIYNSSTRLGTGGRTCAVYDFGGTQTVTSGTFTVLMPTNDGNNAVLRIQ